MKMATQNLLKLTKMVVVVEVVTVADVDDEDCVGNSLLHIWS